MKDKLKVSVYNTKYYINQAKKTVTCVLDFELRGPDRFREILFNFIYLTKDPFKWRVVMTARLDPQDEFDSDKGCQVARAKAETSMYLTTAKLLDRFTNYMLYDLLPYANNFQVTASQVVNHNNEYLSKM